MQRACFLVKVKDDRIQEYLRAHQTVWPAVLAAIRASGLRNYSLFIRPNGMIVGYFEGKDIRDSLRRLAQTEANARWQTHVAPFFEGESGDVAASGPEWLEQYFYLA